MIRLKFRLFISLFVIVFFLIQITVPVYEAPYIKKGDLNSDGSVSSEDCGMILKISAKTSLANGYKGKNAADVNQDGKITPTDARYTLLSSMGLISLSDPGKLSSYTVAVKTDNPAVNTVNKNTSVPAAASVMTGTNVQISTNKTYIYPDLSQLMKIEGYFIIITYGWGHCVGMSQYGAVSMARLGCPYTQILQYYYPGVQIYAENYPATVSLYGSRVDTVEMIARIVQQEISGITYRNDTLDINALRAQAVAAYTNMKYSGYRVQGCTYASSINNCRSDVIKAAKEVAGQYMTYSGKTIYAYYGALSAGVTASSQAVWNTNLGYAVNVPSYWDCNESEYTGIKLITPERMKDFILSYDSSISLSDNPAEWIQILTHDDAVNENTGYVYKMRIGDKIINNRAGMIFRDDILDCSIKSPCFNIIYNGQLI